MAPLAMRAIASQAEANIPNHPMKKSFIVIGATALSFVFMGTAMAGPRVREVNNREHNQQDRIAQGILNHELTPAEVARLEAGEAKIKHQERMDFIKNGGAKLTPRQLRRLNRELDMLSQRIHKQKHD